MRVRVRLVGLVGATAVTALATWIVVGWLSAPSGLGGLPSAPTLAYARPDGSHPTDLAAAMRAVGPHVVDSNDEWRVFLERYNNQISTLEADRQWQSLQRNVRVDLMHAQYVLLSDTSPVVSILPRVTLSPLHRRPVWMVPVTLRHDTSPPGARSYLVLDAHSGRLLEHLHVIPVDPFDACTRDSSSPLDLGRLFCLARHAGNARSMAYRSVA